MATRCAAIEVRVLAQVTSAREAGTTRNGTDQGIERSSTEIEQINIGTGASLGREKRARLELS